MKVFAVSKKVTFLFGAGADSVYDICKGVSFIEPLLLDYYAEERKKLLGDTMGRYSLLYPSSKKIYFQTIISNQEAAKEVFGKEFVEKCIRYYNKEDNDHTFFDTICKGWYNLLTKHTINNGNMCSEEARQFFLNYAVFFDSLDEKMNDLRNTPLNNNGKRIINAYATIFILMMKQSYDIPDGFSWSYTEVFDFLRENTVKNLNNNSYYQVLKKKIDTLKKKEKTFVATTNYTEFAEKILGSDVAYLHGKLNWFEDYQHLVTYDCRNENEYQKALAHTDTLVPFILIPSGVKPIICKRQVEEFHKFIEDLEQSDILCILGYRLNSEDNHINSIIAEWLMQKNKKLVYFNYKQEINLKNLEWMKEMEESVVAAQEQFSAEELLSFFKSQDKVLDITIGKSSQSDDYIRFEKTIKCLLSN